MQIQDCLALISKPGSDSGAGQTVALTNKICPTNSLVCNIAKDLYITIWSRWTK